jgi:choline dehydrogenase-like flavoprotein
MGRPSDPGSVVDDELMVLGVDGLAIADASVMPVIPRAGTNLASMMIGERAGRRLGAG